MIGKALPLFSLKKRITSVARSRSGFPLSPPVSFLLPIKKLFQASRKSGILSCQSRRKGEYDHSPFIFVSIL